MIIETILYITVLEDAGGPSDKAGLLHTAATNQGMLYIRMYINK